MGNMDKIVLSNQYQIPQIVMGTSVDDRVGNRKKLIKNMCSIVEFAVCNGIVAFDTSRDYQNEHILGEVFQNLINGGSISREDLFITTKVGNSQQRKKNMREQIESSLRSLKLDYLDLWLLHWPMPDFYVDNWKQVCEIYREGKVKAIGIANCRERHIEAIKASGAEVIPQVVQIEYHPFRTIDNMRRYCLENHIQIEAYSANCVMLPFVRENVVLNKLAQKYSKSITQIMMRWHIQQGTIPIFSSMNKDHILNNIDIFDFSLEEDEMNDIFSLNCDYKFHPESINCPGY